MKILLFILLLLLPLTAFADADLMVKAGEYWKDGKPTTDWTKKDFVEFWQQTHKGEIIDVYEVGTDFGRCKPPKFIRITVTGVTVEQVKLFLDPLTEGFADTILVKQRRYYFRRPVIDSALVLWERDSTHFIMTKQQALILLKEYNIAAIKQKIIDRLQR